MISSVVAFDISLRVTVDSSRLWLEVYRRCNFEVEHSRLAVLLKLSATVINKFFIRLLYCFNCKTIENTSFKKSFNGYGYKPFSHALG